jgi:hypothetical protein
MSITPPIAPPIAPNLASRDYFPNAWLPSQYPCERPEEERCLTGNWRAHTPLPGPCAFLRWIPQGGTHILSPRKPGPAIHTTPNKPRACGSHPSLPLTACSVTRHFVFWLLVFVNKNKYTSPPSFTTVSLLTRLLLRLIDHEPSFVFILFAPLASYRVVVDSTHDRNEKLLLSNGHAQPVPGRPPPPP